MLSFWKITCIDRTLGAIACFVLKEQDQFRTSNTLILKLQANQSQDAWDRFCSEYGKFIYAIIVRSGASVSQSDDIHQTILVKLWKQLPTYQYDPDKSKFRSWLGVITRNATYDFLRSETALKNRESKSSPPEGFNDDFDEIVEQEWKVHLTSRALERLKGVVSEQSLNVFKKVMNGQSEKDIAKEYQLQPNSIGRIKNRVKSRLILEIAKLREELE